MNSMGEKIGVNKDIVRRDEGRIVLEEKRRRYLRAVIVSTPFVRQR